jgi:creatinine amidohydrolase
LNVLRTPSRPDYWERHATTTIAARKSSVAILPIHGAAAHGLGLGWDIEEVIATALVERSLSEIPPPVQLTVLPPLYLSLDPYQDSLSGTDPDTFYDVVKEFAAGVKETGFRKLVLWSSHPWNTEIVDVISRDIRIDLNLQTFVVELGGLGLSLHPRFGDDRARVQSLGAHLTKQSPVPEPVGEPIDENFRPGNWTKLPPVPAGAKTATGSEILKRAATHLAKLWTEISQRAVSGAEVSTAHADSADRLPVETPAMADSSPALASLTGPEIKRVAREQNPLVILPIGAIEQHGPHLPVGVDTIIAQAAAAGLKRRLGDDVQIAPVLAYGKSNEHADFPGTVGMTAKSLRKILKSQIRNLHGLGFRQFAVLNTHGGNSSVITYTLREIQRELGVRAGMLRLPVSLDLDEQESTWGFHAGEWETAVMLAITPELVRMDRAICHYPATLEDAGELRPESAPAIFSWQTRDIAPEGVMGDATRATPTNGQLWLDEAVDAVAEQIRQLPPP